MEKITLYKIKYSLDPRNVMRYKSDNGGELTEILFNELSSRLHCERLIRLEKTFNGLCVLICSDRQITESEIKEINSAIAENSSTGEIGIEMEEVSVKEIWNSTGLSEDDKQYLASLGDSFLETEKTEPVKNSAPQHSAKVSEPRPEEPKEDVFEAVEKLVAMDEFKAWAREMKALAEKKLNQAILKQSLMSMSYLVSVNSGNGRSNMIRLMGKVLARLLGKADANVREIVVDPDKESKGYNLDRIISDFSYVDAQNENLAVFALSIDKFLNNMYMTSWMKLMDAVWDSNKNAIFIFVLPYLENSAIFDMHKKIEDVLPNRVLIAKPLTNDDYMCFFELYFKKFDMKITDSAFEIIPKKIAEEKSDGRFYGINTVNKICDEILYNKLKSAVASSEDCFKEVTGEDVQALIQRPGFWGESEKSGMEQLNSLISLHSVKSVIKEIIATIKMQRSMGVGAQKSLHMMFSGSPGTGKTVVARILGQILREEKILSVGGFYEVTRKDLVGMYIGHTAPKTAEVCQAAYGSVLFIDEAYMLDGGSENDYGKEAISTLIAEMENKRDNFVVVFAGYEKELEQLFDLNPGLRDRIPYRVHFENYNKDELEQIFYKMLPDEFECSAEFNESAKEFFENLSDEMMQDKNFSNARFVRNLVERIVSKAALRMQMEAAEERKLVLVKSDFELAVSDGEFKTLNTKKRSTQIGFSF